MLCYAMLRYAMLCYALVAQAVRLLRFLEQLEYDALVLDESVGPIAAQRNLLAVPRGSPAATAWPLRNATHFLTAVTAANVRDRWPGRG